MSELKKVEALMHGAAESLARSLKLYWPVVNPDKNGLQESNLTTHLASQALKSGFNVYPQASNADLAKGHSRIDLLLLGSTPQNKIAVLVEAKKLYSAEKAGEMVSDYEKICSFQFVKDKYGCDVNANTQKIALLLAITEKPENSSWWEAPYECKSGGWNALKSVLDAADARKSIHLKAAREQYVLYAAFKIGSRSLLTQSYLN